MKKSFLIIITCIICIIAFQAFTTHNDPDFKNLQILPKDISHHDLDSVMHHFTASLGVKCNFCHVRNEAEKKMDFASDDKPEKKVARKMMLMAIDINKNYFKGMDMEMDMDHDMDSSMNKDMHHDMDTTIMNAEPSKYMLQSVTCFTCHRGDPHPESKIPPMPQGPKPPMPQPPAQNK
jgi:hypothetical protein